MKILKICAIAAAMTLSASASAYTVLDLGPFTLGYDESTSFGGISSTFSSSGDIYGFAWTVPDSVQVTSSDGSPASTNVPLPSFTITANAGWALSNTSAFLGNLSYVEVGGAITDIIAHADVSVDGGPTVPTGSMGVGWVVTGSGPGYSLGYFADTFSIPGGFYSVSVTNAAIDLSATGGSFSTIVSQPQNELKISLMAVPVPEPETYAMMIAGLGLLGFVVGRRKQI